MRITHSVNDHSHVFQTGTKALWCFAGILACHGVVQILKGNSVLDICQENTPISSK